jgi:hypothetical protein
MLGVWKPGACDSVDAITTVLRKQVQILREIQRRQQKLNLLGSLGERIVDCIDGVYRLFIGIALGKGYSVRSSMSKEHLSGFFVIDTHSTVISACERNIHQHDHETIILLGIHPFLRFYLACSRGNVSVSSRVGNLVRGTQLE